MKKRIISSLLVVAMLLTAMVPAVTAETPAPDAVVNAGNAIAAAAEEMTFPADGSNVAMYCPACEEVVTWEALGETTWWGNVEGKHGYLAGDMSYSGQKDGYGVFVTKNVCLHLNGHDLVVTDDSAIGCRYAEAELNIMGNGIVSGAPATMLGTALRVFEGGTINLYGGTYTKAAGAALNAPVMLLGSESTDGKVNIYGNTVIDGGDVAGDDTYGCVALINDSVEVNMYSGTITDGEAEYGGNLMISKGVFNLHGGEITNGIATKSGGNIHIAGGAFNMCGGEVSDGNSTGGSYGGNINIAGGEVNIEGGTISGGRSYYRGGNIHIDGGSLEISGGTVTGGTASQGNSVNIQPNATATISGGTFTGGNIYMKNNTTLSGDPVIEELTVDASYKFTVGEMTQGASVGVNGSRILSTNGDLQTSAQYFYGVKAEGDAVIPTKADGKLSYSPAKLPAGLANNGTAYCAACGKDVTWTMGVMSNGGGDFITWNGSANGMHGFLAANKEVETVSNNWSKGAAVYTKFNTCFHLNGMSLTVKNAPAIWVNTEAGNLTILGSGTVRGKAAKDYEAGAITITDGATVNLMGGTYKKTQIESGISSVLLMGTNYYGVYNIYRGAVIDGELQDTSEVPGSVYIANANGIVNMYGGEIRNGKTAASGGNLHVRRGTFNMYGGTITGGQADKGGNVALLYADGAVNLYGGVITGGQATKGGNIYLSNGEVEVSGGTIAGTGSAGEGAGTYVLSGTLTLKGTANVTCDSMQGNIYVDGGVLNVDAGWTGKAGVSFKDVAEGYGETVTLGTSTGDYSGTLINELGLQPNIYGVDDKLVVSGEQVCTADTAVWAKDAVTENIAAPGSYIKLYTDNNTYEIPAGQTVAVDVNGKSVTFTGNGTLQGMDSTNDNYELSAAVATVADTVTVELDVTGGANGNRYIAIKAEDGTYSFHRLNIYMSAVSLRTSACGIYYKAMYECDSVLAGKAEAYGVVVSVNNMPGADFLAESETADNNCYTVMTPDETFGNGTLTTSGSIFNIMKTEYDNPNIDVAEENARRAAIPVYASPYVLFDLGGGKLAVGDDSNAGLTVEDQSFDGVAYSLNDVMEAIDEGYASYSEETQKQVDQFYFKWAESGMSQSFDNIGTSSVAINAVVTDGVAKLTQKPTPENGAHYYLDTDVSYTGSGEGQSFISASETTGEVGCVHLNGNTITATNRIVLYGASGTRNVMGNPIWNC